MDIFEENLKEKLSKNEEIIDFYGDKMEKKHKVTLRESELRYVVLEAVRRTLNERINRMLCAEGGPGGIPGIFRKGDDALFVRILAYAACADGSVETKMIEPERALTDGCRYKSCDRNGENTYGKVLPGSSGSGP